jgi:cell division protein FtsB
MLINIRHLIITIVSVFLALSMGILIGIQLESHDLILKQQESIIDKMEIRFEELNKTREDLKNEIKKLDDINLTNNIYINNVFPDYIKDKLNGLNVAIIETTEDYSFKDLRKALKGAGANISSIINITDKVVGLNEDEKNAFLEYYSIKNNNVGDDKNPSSLIINSIIDAMVLGKSFEEIQYLAENGYLHTYGSFEHNIDFVIIAGGSNQKTEKVNLIDIPLAKEFLHYSVPVAGVENSQAEYSYMEYYKKERISTVDNIDNVIGQTSIILIIEGIDGNYGIKKSAESLMPQLTKEED